MLNQPDSLQHIDYERDFEKRIISLLGEVPFLELSTKSSKVQTKGSDGPDLYLTVNVGGKQWTLLCEFKSNTQLRHIKSAIYQLHHFSSAVPGKQKYAILVGPYFSPEAVSLIRKESMGFADLAGNCLLTFDKVYIERSGARNPFISTRKQRSLFAPKSSRILMALLQDPSRSWGTLDLAAAAHVSPGQVSNVKKALLDREWARTDKGGMQISNPGGLLDAWRGAYEKRAIKRSRYYTPLHGKPLDEAIKVAFESASPNTNIAFSSTSAARWMAPFVRDSSTHFYADKKGEDLLKKNLKLESVSRGENVIVESPQDEGVFFSRIEAAPGIWTTNLIQTYLDLSVLGERGQEAADHLRVAKIDPTLSKKH